MLNRQVTIKDTGHGEVQLKNETRGTTAHAEMLANFLSTIPPDQRGFFKECRVVAVVPFYQAEGDFQANLHVMKMDDDQLDWAIKNHPEYRVGDNTKNNHLATGGKIIVSG